MASLSLLCTVAERRCSNCYECMVTCSCSGRQNVCVCHMLKVIYVSTITCSCNCQLDAVSDAAKAHRLPRLHAVFAFRCKQLGIQREV